ncbi:MAG: SusC/RagA family TonB-linked outer membrane protein [Reichenbachiella sp.]|uniref:SusC/RagA family TonB-linked outer membrane protein n=1 Tax=Reichenbachiella sp. TaxID=2184521 RepID=UPI0032981A59
MIQKLTLKIRYMLRCVLIIPLIFVCNLLYAQDATISGRVISSSDGAGLPGVTITVEGTTIGAITDLDGNYKINLPSNTEELTFNFIGYATQKILINGRSTIDISLIEDATELREVVVTALGVEKETKSLGYSVTEFEGENMVKARESNPVSTLTGKVAGLSIKTSTDFFQNPSIEMRGGTPLIVIDGVPNPNADFWEISPDDVENISVLKGATASALYGSIGRNGALLITTKRGKNELTIEVNSSTQFQTGFLRVPETQQVYGQGDNGAYEWQGASATNGVWVWGPKLDGSYSTVQIDSNGESTPFVNKGKDNMKNFFQTGLIQSNNISVTGGNDQGSFRVSLSNSHQKGQVPNTEMDIKGITVSGSYKLSKKVQVDASLNYGRQESDNYPKIGYGSQSYLYTIMWMGNNFDIRDFEDYWVEGQEGFQQKQWNDQWFNNPYFMAHEYNQGWYRNSSYGQVNLNYNILEGFDFKIRSGFSYYSVLSTEKEPKSYLSEFNVVSNGNYFLTNESNYNFNSDALLSYRKEISENLSITANLGGAVRDAQYLQTGTYTDGLIVPNYYNIANSANPIVGENRQADERVGSVYGTLDVEIFNAAFIGFTGRNDWVSTLPIANNSFFYPSVSASLVLSDIFEMPDVLSFVKLRSSWAQVSDGLIDNDDNLGINNRPYNHIQAYNQGPSWNNVNSVNLSTIKVDPDIKPATSNTWEIGLDTRLFDGRLGLDIAYYNILDFNNIIAVPVSEGSGYSSRLENGGEFRRRGIEMLLTVTPIKTSNFRWDISTNWTQYRRYLEESPDGSGRFNNIDEGDRMDEIWTDTFLKSPGGQYIIENGSRLLDPFLRNLGYDDADWVFGVQQTFRFKDFSLGISADGRIGGKIVSTTNQEMHWSGTHPNTVIPEREDAINGISSYVDPGVVVVDGSVTYDENGNITADSRRYAPNATAVNYISWAKDIYGRGESYSDFYYDETFLKLREVILTYRIPKSALDKVFLKEASVSLVGRNLLLLSTVPQIDPDQGFDDQFQSPSTRNIGFNINFKF